MQVQVQVQMQQAVNQGCGRGYISSTSRSRSSNLREQQQQQESFEINPIPDETTELNSSHNHNSTLSGTSSTSISNTNSTSTSTHDNTTDSRPILSSSPSLGHPSSSPSSSLQESQQHQEQRAGGQDGQENNHTGEGSGPDEEEITPFDTEVQNQLQSLLHQRNTFQHNSYVWTVIIVMLLFRLWVEALISGDLGLLFISLICTSYFWRWKQWRSLQEQRLADRVENLLRLTVVMDGEEEREGTGAEESSGHDEESGGAAQGQGQRQQRRMERNRRLRMELSRQDHVDFDMLSFQAQLALALMESQRIMQNGNYGRDGDDDENRMRGVSDDKKERWESFEYTKEDEFYQTIESIKKKNTSFGYSSSHSNYTSGKSSGGAYGISDDGDEYEAPTCCICLCEYEKGDKLTSLQCGHTYHSDCIDSWCSNHVRCPLCNFDLDQNNHSNDGVSNSNVDSIV